MTPSPTLRGTLLPPIAIGLGYAAGKAIAQGESWGGLYWQSPFMFAFLAGLVMALALRPVLARVPWRRGTAFAVAAALLLGMGPAASWGAAWLATAAGAAPFPLVLPASALPELLGGLMAAGLMGALFRPQGGEIGLASLRARMRRHAPKGWTWRLGTLALVALGLAYAVGALGLWLGEALRWPILVDSNPWFELTALAGAPGGRLALLAIEALRALALVLPLLPLALVLRGTAVQVSLVFALLVFVIGDFAPLAEQQPYPSSGWLMGRAALGLLRATLIGAAGARLIGQIHPPAPRD